AGKCGQPEIEPQLDDGDRIIGGRSALSGSWPWQAGIYTTKYSHFCGGALISDQYVLTAAHCVWARMATHINVHLGSHQRLSRDRTELLVGVEDVCVFPKFRITGKTVGFEDIAILKLSHPVNITATIQPVCLPSNGEELPSGSELYITGWGVTRADRLKSKSVELKQLLTRAIPTKECYDRDGRQAPPSRFCGPHDKGSSCYGDSGGPVVHNSKGTWTLHGIVTGGPTICGGPEDPLYFAKVSYYMERFIQPFMDPRTSRKDIRKTCWLS
ncbi:unnamed protein product, partial [Ixodes hexagonus]